MTLTFQGHDHMVSFYSLSGNDEEGIHPSGLLWSLIPIPAKWLSNFGESEAILHMRLFCCYLCHFVDPLTRHNRLRCGERKGGEKNIEKNL